MFETEVFGKSVQVPTGANIKRSDLEDGETPRITVKGINNGVYGKFNCKINTKLSRMMYLIRLFICYNKLYSSTE